MLLIIQGDIGDDANSVGADSEAGDIPIIQGTSTKQPMGKERKLSKRQKLEVSENELIEKAIQSLERTSQSTSHLNMAYRNDVFGQRIALYTKLTSTALGEVTDTNSTV